MAEMVNVLDKNGKVTGSAMRDVVHRDGQWHRGIHVLVFDDKKRVLLPIRSIKKSLFPGCYDVSVSEHVMEGEEYADAAKRGLNEELGVENTALTPLAEIKMSYALTDNHFSMIYSCMSSGKVELDKEEIESAEFVSVATIKALLSKSPEKFSSWAAEIYKWLFGETTQIEVVREFSGKKGI